MSASILVNKVPYDFYSLEFDTTFTTGTNINIGIIEGVEAIDYSEKYNREKLHGTSRLAIDRTEGDIEHAASITWLESWFRYLLDRANQANISRSALRMTIGISYGFKGEVLHTDTLVDVAFGEIGKSFSRGPGALMTKVPLDPMNIFMDGVDPLGNKLSG